jgi:hypothetical protein
MVGPGNFLGNHLGQPLLPYPLLLYTSSLTTVLHPFSLTLYHCPPPLYTSPLSLSFITLSLNPSSLTLYHCPSPPPSLSLHHCPLSLSLTLHLHFITVLYHSLTPPPLHLLSYPPLLHFITTLHHCPLPLPFTTALYHSLTLHHYTSPLHFTTTLPPSPLLPYTSPLSLHLYHFTTLSPLSFTTVLYHSLTAYPFSIQNSYRTLCAVCLPLLKSLCFVYCLFQPECFRLHPCLLMPRNEYDCFGLRFNR